MDKLDKIALLLLVVLIVVLTIISQDYQVMVKDGLKRSAAASSNMTGASEIPSGKIKMLKALVANNNIQKAEALLSELLKEYPYEGEPHMLMGDVMIRKQDPVSAMYSYREAVDLNPDYVDKNTHLFQGRKIKNTTEEAREVIETALSNDPGNKKMREAKKIMYYVLRKLAGSCG